MRRTFGGVRGERVGRSGAPTDSGGRDLRARSTLTRAAPGAAITNPPGGGGVSIQLRLLPSLDKSSLFINALSLEIDYYAYRVLMSFSR